MNDVAVSEVFSLSSALSLKVFEGELINFDYQQLITIDLLIFNKQRDSAQNKLGVLLYRPLILH